MDGHAEAPGRRAVDEGLGARRVEAGGRGEVREGRVDAEADVALGDARRGEALGDVVEAAAGARTVRLRDGGADLGLV